jgi:hypothetical protein
VKIVAWIDKYMRLLEGLDILVILASIFTYARFTQVSFSKHGREKSGLLVLSGQLGRDYGSILLPEVHAALQLHIHYAFTTYLPFFYPGRSDGGAIISLDFVVGRFPLNLALHEAADQSCQPTTLAQRSAPNKE